MNRGNRVLNGAFATIYLNNVEVAFLKSFSVNIKENREDVVIGLDIDSKRTSTQGEGEMEVQKVSSNLQEMLLQNIKDGIDTRYHIIGLNADPDAIGSQKERISIPNVWFEEFDLLAFEKGEVQTNSLSFKCTVTDIDFLEGIK